MSAARDLRPVDAGKDRPSRAQDFSAVLRLSLREEDILAARSRMAELEADAEGRGFEVRVGAVGLLVEGEAA